LRKRWAAAGLTAAICVAGWVFAPHLLHTAGAALVESGQPHRADAILVLAGDPSGARLLKACELLRADFAPVALVSGPMPWYGVNEADAAIAFGGRNGCDVARLRPVYMKALSTREEAHAYVPVLREFPAQNFLIVTSSYHTARAGRIFRGVVGGGARFTMVPSPDRYFAPDRWWKTREGQKIWFFEISKTAADWIGL
jgi:uncharacterized SAM-binding protein YcdF (DUF218 family)